MQTFYKVMFVTLVGFLWTCQKSDQPNEIDQLELVQSIKDFPALLDRNPAIQNGKEWEAVQSAYAQFRNESIHGDLESTWKMAKLFIQEARVTGEHGHYYSNALKLLDKVLNKDQAEEDLIFRTLTTKAAILLSQHEFSQALEVAQKAYEMNQFNAEICGVLVDAHVELGDYEKAVEMADKMVAIRPDIRSYARISYLRELFGDLEGAVEAMEMALESGYPGFEQTAWTQLELGNLYLKQGNQEAAQQNYKAILSYRPEYPFAIAALAEVYQQQQNYEEAKKLLEKACNIIPEVGFYEQLAHIYKAKGQLPLMEQTLETIWPMLADDVATGHNMNLEYAQIHLKLTEDYDKALQYAEAEFQKRPNNIDTNRLLASIYQKMGNEKMAAEYDQKLATLMNWQSTSTFNTGG